MDILLVRVNEIIDNVKYINIASVCDDNTPWNTPLYAANNGKLTFYWRSWINSQHSKNIRTSPGIFITLYDSTREFGQNHRRCIYIKAKAFELSDEKEVNKALTFFSDNQHMPEEFLGDSVKRLYMAVPEKVWLNDLSESQLTKDTLQMRVEVPIELFE